MGFEGDAPTLLLSGRCDGFGGKSRRYFTGGPEVKDRTVSGFNVKKKNQIIIS